MCIDIVPTHVGVNRLKVKYTKKIDKLQPKIQTLIRQRGELKG